MLLLLLSSSSLLLLSFLLMMMLLLFLLMSLLLLSSFLLLLFQQWVKGERTQLKHFIILFGIPDVSIDDILHGLDKYLDNKRIVHGFTCMRTETFLKVPGLPTLYIQFGDNRLNVMRLSI